MKERGFYLHPKLYDLPVERGSDPEGMAELTQGRGKLFNNPTQKKTSEHLNPEKIMYNKNFVAVLLCFFVLTFFAAEARSQHAIPRSVFSNGGTVMSNGSYRVMSTLGQTAIGYAVNGSHAYGAGFWYRNVDIATSVESASDGTLPATFRLDQNYPNPFNPSTTIQFGVPIKSAVSLKLFDLLGREVAELVKEEMPAGEYNINFQAKGLASGVYLYRLVAEAANDQTSPSKSRFVEVRKLTFLK